MAWCFAGYGKVGPFAIDVRHFTSGLFLFSFFALEQQKQSGVPYSGFRKAGVARARARSEAPFRLAAASEFDKLRG